MIGCAAFLWIAAHLVLCVNAKRLVQRELGARLKTFVLIGSVRTNFLGSFTFRDIRLSPSSQDRLPAITVKLRPPLRLVLESHSVEFGDIYASWSFRPIGEWPWRGAISFAGVKSEAVLERFKEIYPDLPKLTGNLTVAADVSGALKPQGLMRDWLVIVNGDKIIWERSGKGDKVPLSVDMRLTPKNVTINSLTIKSKIKIKGVIETPWQSPVLHLIARAEDASVSQLLKLVSPEMGNNFLGGSTSFLARIDGELNALAVKGDGSVTASYAKFDLPEARGSFLYSGNRLTASADFAEGRFDLRGNISGKDSTWTLAMADVSLASVAKANNWQAVGGVVDANLTMGPGGKPIDLDGTISIDRFRWGRFKAGQRVVGRINVNDRFVRVDADALKLKGSVRDSVVKIDDFRITFGKDSRIAASGAFNTETKGLNFNLNANNVPPDLWPPLVERYPAITGALDVKGSVKGKWKSLLSECDVSFDNLKFIPTGSSWKGQAKLKGSPRQISLEKIDVAGGYTGQVTWMPEQKGLFHIKAEMDGANPALFFDIFKSTAMSAGVVTGQVDLDLRDLKPVGVSSFSWSSGGIGDFQFDALGVSLRFEPGKVYFDEFMLSQGSRAIKGSGGGTSKKDGWDTTAIVQFQHWGNDTVYLDGETRWTGHISWPSLEVNGNLSAPIVWLNEFSIEDVHADIRKRGHVWIIDGDSNKAAKFHVRFDQADQLVDGSFNARALRLEDFLAKALPDPTLTPRGAANVSARFKGPVGRIAVKMDFDTIDTLWRDERFDSSASIRINASTITISNGDLRLKKGGSFSITGAVARGPESVWTLSGKGKDLNLQSIFRLLNWPVTWEGKTDASFEMSGPMDDRVTRVQFRGSHKGFGPFPLPGDISGDVTESARQWDFSGVRVGSGDGYLAMLPGSNIYMDRDGSGAMHAIMESRNLRAGVVTLFGGAELTATWRGKSDLDSGAVPPPIEMEVFARSLWVNQYVLDGNLSHLTLRKGEVELSPILGSDQQLSGKLIHAGYPDIVMEKFRLLDNGSEKIFLNGHVGPAKWDYALRLEDLDASILRGLFDTSIPINGKMSADLLGRGNSKSPDIAGELKLRDARLDMLPVDEAQCKISYKNGIVDLRDIQASRKRGFQLAGRVRFQADPDVEKKQDPEIDLMVDKGDLTFLRDVWPEITKARGTFTARFQMSTKSWGRSVSGFLDAQKVSIVSAHTPSLTKGQAKVRLDKNRLHIEDTHARLGNGTLALNGYVDFKNGRPNFYNLSLRTTDEKGISLRIPELSISAGPFLGQFGILKQRLSGASRSEPLVNLILKGPAESPLLAGTVELENTVFTYPPNKETTLEPASTAFRRWAKNFWEKLRLDLSLVAGNRTWYQNQLVDANVSGAIQFTGPATDLAVDGRIQSTQGSIVYSGSEFRIKDATLELVTGAAPLSDVDNKQTLVYLKATAEKQVFYTDGLSNNNQDTIVMAVDRSLIGEIQPRFYSRYNPNLSPERALQLALGLPLSSTVDDNNLLPDQRANSQAASGVETDKVLRLGLVQLLDSSLASPLARALARNTGLIDVIRITYQEKDPLADNVVETDPAVANNNLTQNEFLRYAKGTKVKFGRGLSSRLFADYSVRVDEFQNQVDLRHEVELSYQLKRNLYLRGVSELDNQRQLGRVPDRRAILENQWRFGLPKPKVPQKPPKESKASPASSLYNRPS